MTSANLRFGGNSVSGVIGIVGLGTMGLGIAQVFALAGFQVVATDAHAAARDSASARLGAALQSRVSAGKLTEVDRDATIARFQVVEGLTALAPAALVIEAIIETTAAKNALFAALEAIVAPDAVLATNTSSLPVQDIAAGLGHPERLLALHFFNPAAAMKLVELAPHSGTHPDTTARARALTEAAGKTVILCRDRPGFIVNRCARPYYGEALALLEEGRQAPEIDAAMQAAGYRLGPFALIDLIGADINLAATEGLSQAMGGHPRYHVFSALRAQVAIGNLGRKTGRGFVFPDPAGTIPADADTIALRIEAALVNEAAWLLAEGGTTTADIDTALKLGLNFPRGPFEMLLAHGIGTIRATLAALEVRAPDALKPRYHPAPALEPV